MGLADTGPQRKRRLAGRAALLGLLVVAAVPLVTRSGYLASLGSQIGIHALIVVGLGLLVGYAGQVSLGHAAFYGLGAYSTAILTTRAGAPPLVAMVAGMALSALIAVAVGTPALRLRGHYLAMFTLGLGICAQIVMEQAKALTNGFDGITSVPPFGLGPLVCDSDARAYVLVVLVLAGAIAVARNLVGSRFGRALRALHESEEAASACGVDVPRTKLQVFVFSAVLAAIAGSLYAHTIGFVSPDPFGFRCSVQLVVMVVVGGSMSVWGPLAGAALFTVLAQVLQNIGEHNRFVADLDTVLFGAVLVCVVIFSEKGLASIRWRRRIGAGRRGAVDGTA